MPNLDFVFKPKSVAVVGASTKEGSIGNDILKNLINGFSGKIYPVNPKVEKLLGLQCFPSLENISAKIDLVIIVVPAAIVLNILESAAKLGIKGVIIISAGFKEIGNIDSENKIREICLKNDIALIGPNCLGVINPLINLNASFAVFSAKPGDVAFVSQSGALCTAILDSATNMGIGFSKFVSIGNKAVLDEVDIMEYCKKDLNTKVIAMYVEQLSDSERIIKMVTDMRNSSKPIPVVVLKSGKTLAGASASASHTGALAGNDAIYNALFRQAGIIRANNTEELFDYSKIFSNNKIQSAKRVAVITNAGGPGVLAVDSILENNLELAKLSDNTKKSLKKYLPESASVNNPVDVLGDALSDRFDISLKHVLSDKNVDSVVIILTPQSVTEIQKTAEVISSNYKKYKKTMAVVFMGEEMVRPGLDILKNHKIATYSYPESAIKALSALENFYQNTKIKREKIKEFKDVKKDLVTKIFSQARAKDINSFPEASALEILQAYNLPILVSHVAKNREEAEKIAKEIGRDVVLKIVSPDILHKSDCGGIMLNVKIGEVGNKFDEIIKNVSRKCPTAKIEGVLIVEMISQAGLEMIVGSVKDPSLGHALMLGLGGIYVEIIKDVVFGINPLSPTDVYKMIDSLKSKQILDGARGQAELDKEAIVECVLRFAQLLRDFPEIKEIDINPLIVFPKGQGVKILDARIII